MFIAWIWMALFMLIPLFVLFFLLKYLFSKKNKNDQSDQVYPDQEYPAVSTPLDILKSSYARGDISREEFLQKRDDILEK